MNAKSLREAMTDTVGRALLPVAAKTIAGIDTPAVVIDLDVVQRNIQRFQDYCDIHRLNLRPHIKTHKIPALAHLQVKAGAAGINCQKVSEAEVMADAGITDILITYNILGADKLARLRRLSERCSLSVTADNAAVVQGLSEAFAGSKAPLGVLVECDTGAKRCGVQTPKAATELAASITAAPGLELRGLMTYPPAGGNTEADAWLARAKGLCEEAGLPCPVVSSGGTPDMWSAEQLKTATEYRVGTYIYNDRSLVARGVCRLDDCALTVLATVVSRPTAERAILDTGSKSLTSDLLGLEGFGVIPDLPEAVIYGLNEEHGFLDLSASRERPGVGDKVRIVPNHACVISNLVDRVYAVRGEKVSGTLAVGARGCST